MPSVVISLTPEQYGNLETIADDRKQSVEDAGRDLLVQAIDDELNKSSASAYQRGVGAVREGAIRDTVFGAAFDRTITMTRRR